MHSVVQDFLLVRHGGSPRTLTVALTGGATRGLSAAIRGAPGANISLRLRSRTCMLTIAVDLSRGLKFKLLGIDFSVFFPVHMERKNREICAYAPKYAFA